MFRKFFQIIIVFIVLFISTGNIYAEAGPMKPEAAQFQPVDATDMVSLLTGDFTYNMALLEVPGPEGGWPLNLCYQAGVGPNTEATWVGLGWTLNPGAINRFVNVFPDDWYNSRVFSHKEATVEDEGYMVGLSYGPVGIGLEFNANGGVSGVNASCTIGYRVGEATIGLGLDMSTSSGVSVGIGLNYGSIGLGLQISSQSGLGAYAGLSIDGAASIKMSFQNGSSPSFSVGMLGVSFSSSGGGARVSAFGVGMSYNNASATSGVWTSESSSEGFSIPIPTPCGVFGITLGHWKRKLRMDVDEWGNCTGTIMQPAYKNNWQPDLYHVNDLWSTDDGNISPEEEVSDNLQDSVSASLRSSTEVWNKMDASTYYTKLNGSINYSTYLLPSPDSYSASAQGIAGVFQPYYEWSYGVKTSTITRGNVTGPTCPGYYELDGCEPNKGRHIKFRFLDDLGGNFFSRNAEQQIEPIRKDAHGNNYYGSKIVQPAINRATGRLEGFRITAPDGKIYEFFQPVLSYFSHNYAASTTNTTQFSYHEQMTPYATSWLLTAIKGPDYYDADDDKKLSSKDWGFWVKFNYSVNNLLLGWRTPVGDRFFVENDTKQYSFGHRDEVKLESVETASHTAFFSTSSRDEIDLPNTTDIAFSASSIMAEHSHTNQWSIEFSVTAALPVSDDLIKQLMGSGQGTVANVEYVMKNGNVVSTRDYLPNWSETQIPLTPNSAKSSTLSFNFTVTGSFMFSQDPEITTLILRLKNSNRLNTLHTVSKLDKITVKRKVFDNDGLYNENQTKSIANPGLEGIQFDYDYSLVKNVNNQQKGKLTLKSVQKTGVNGAISIPSTQFSYYRDDVQWGFDNWSYWNGYTSNPNHSANISPLQADLDASTWNLASVYTPLGSLINVKYESDRLENISGLNSGYVSYKTILIPSYSAGQTEAGLERIDQISNINSLLADPDNRFYIMKQGIDESYSPPRYRTEFIPLTSVSINSNNRVVFSPAIDFVWQQDFYTYEYWLTSKYTYGCGHRVSSVSVTTGTNKKETKYVYRNGATATIPSDYEKIYMGPYVPEEVFTNKGFNSLGQSPVVMYKNVDVFSVGETGDIENGKTSYEYYVPDECSLNISTEYQTGSSIPRKLIINDKTAIYGKIKNMTVWGKIPGHVGIQPSDFYKISESITSYAFSDELQMQEDSTIGVYKSPDGSHTNSPIGLSSQLSASYPSGCQESEICIKRQNVYITGVNVTNYSYDNDYTASPRSGISSTKNTGFDAFTGSVVVTEAANSKKEKYVSELTPAYWKYPDMLAKNMLAQTSGKKEFLLPEDGSFRPFVNGGLMDSYLRSSSITTWKNWGNGIWRKNDEYCWVGKPDFEEFTSWNADGGDIINKTGQNTKAMWKRTSNITAYDRYSHPVEERGINGIYTSSLYGYGEALPVAIVTNAKIARKTETDIIPKVGNEASYIGFDTTTIEPSQENDFWGIYGDYNFILRSGTDNITAHTGNYFCKVLAGNGNYRYGPTRDFRPENQNGKYVFSCWVKCPIDVPPGSVRLMMQTKRDNDSDNLRYPANSQYYSVNCLHGNGGWKLYMVTIDLNKIRTNSQPSIGDTTLRIRCFLENTSNSDVYLDDIRFHPVNANMCTFSYDPWTLKVTTMTDKNNVTSYYEYDSAGRLKLVRDQDKKIITRHQYHYNRQNQ